MRHTNDGDCEKCNQIFNTYPGINTDLFSWFKVFQARFPEAHISCAGRGRIAQEECFQRGASKAHFGQSAHNYNCAIDLFVNKPENIYPKDWFLDILKPEIPEFIQWGFNWVTFPEMPHLEIKDWKHLVSIGEAKLVEPKDG